MTRWGRPRPRPSSSSRTKLTRKGQGRRRRSPQRRGVRAGYKGVDAPIRRCHTDGNDCDAITDPLLPTAGLGLGLPGLPPGPAGRLQSDEAKKISHESAREAKMRLAPEEGNRASEARDHEKE